MTLHLPSHFADRPDFSPVTEDLSLSTIKNYQGTSYYLARPPYTLDRQLTVSVFFQLRRPLLCSFMTCDSTYSSE